MELPTLTSYAAKDKVNRRQRTVKIICFPLSAVIVFGAVLFIYRWQFDNVLVSSGIMTAKWFCRLSWILVFAVAYSINWLIVRWLSKRWRSQDLKEFIEQLQKL
jgi:hypothetical protein